MDKAVFYNVGVSPYPRCFEEKNTTDSKKAHFITWVNGLREDFKTPRKSSYKSATPLTQIHQYFKIRRQDMKDSGLANTSITALSDECCLVVKV